MLRLWLALCVVHAHSGSLFPWPTPGGREAVQIFFLISGFYMEMILGDRYHSVRTFYCSRGLRIYGPYFLHLAVIVAASILAGLLCGNWLSLAAYSEQPFSHNGAAGVVLSAASNLTVFGQDAVIFLKDNIGEGLMFSRRYADDAFPLHRYLVMPQCWSVSIELCFYLLAPFIHRLGTAALSLLLVGSLALRFGSLRAWGLDFNPWTYRFFPFEAALFLAGMLSQRAIQRIPAWKNAIPSGWIYAGLLVGIPAIGWVSWQATEIGRPHLGTEIPTMAGYLGWAVVVAVLFRLTQSLPLDRAIGELSYPIYLNHMFVIIALRSIPALDACRKWEGVLAAAVSILLAALSYRFIFRWFEQWRHRRVTALA